MIPSTAEATTTVAAARDRLATLVHRLSQVVDHELPPGDVSQLRRLRAEDPGAHAYWKVVAMHLDPAGELPVSGEARDEAERQWAAILSGMATTRGLHRRGSAAGHALAQAGYSELRFTKLLRARDGALLDNLRSAAQFIASKGQPIDWLHLVRLVRIQDGAAAESVRRSLARDYYAALSRANH